MKQNHTTVWTSEIRWPFCQTILLYATKSLRLIYAYLRSFFFIPKAIKLRRTVLFSAAYYLDNNEDINSMYLLPELHFLRYGMYELRNPHPLFDTRFYINQIPSFFDLNTDPVTHFQTIGGKRGLNPHPLFEVNFYSQNCSLKNTANALEHYLTSQSPDWKEPNPLFFTSDYKKQCNLTGFSVPPLLHYRQNDKKNKKTYTYGSLKAVNRCQRFQSNIERFSTFDGILIISGWAFAPDKTISQIGYLNAGGSINYLSWSGLPSDDIADLIDPSAKNNRFTLKLIDNLPANHLDIILIFLFTDGTVAYEFNLERYGLQERPHSYFLQGIFSKMIHDDPSAARILEIGSRNRSGYVSKDNMVPHWFNYTGTDIIAGDNVNVVCDAHHIGSFFQRRYFDYVFSLNVFEHLLIPWKVVLEINKILKIGGKVMIFTHQTMPLHDTPCDYWRFSDKAWQALFNKDTGFVITYSGMGDAVDVVAQKAHSGSYGLSLAPAFLHSMVIAQKVGESSLEWNVNPDGLGNMYPQT